MNFLIYLGLEIIARVIPFFSLIVIAKFTAPEIFGVLTTYALVFELSIIVISNNISAKSRIDYFNDTEYRFRRSLVLDISYSFLLTTFLFSIISVVDWRIFPELKIEFILIASFMRTISLLVLAVCQCSEKSIQYSIIQMSYVITFNVSLIAFLIYEYEISSWLISITMAAFFQMITALFIARKIIIQIYRERIEVSIRTILEQAIRGIKFMPQAFGFWLKLGIDRISLATFFTAEFLGIYMFGFQLLLPIIIVTGVVNLYSTPVINKFLKLHNKSLLLLEYKKYFLGLSIFSFLNLGFAILLITYYFEDYVAVTGFIIFIWMSVVLHSFSLVFLNLCYYCGKGYLVSVIIGVTSIVHLVVNYSLSGAYGINGLLLANIFCNGGTFFLSVIIFNRIIDEFKNHGQFTYVEK